MSGTEMVCPAADLTLTNTFPIQPLIRRTQSLSSLFEPMLDLTSPLDQNEGISQDSCITQDTTLLQPVPYPGIDKDEKEHIERILEKMGPGDPRSSFDSYERDRLKLLGSYYGALGLDSGPVFEVVYVSIGHEKDCQWKGFDIYGQVLVVDDTNKRSFCIYERKMEDAEKVYPDYECLSISYRPIAPIRKGKVVFNLINKTDGTHFKGERHVECSIMDDWEEDQVLSIKRDDGFYVEMLYTMIPFAQIAIVDFLFLVGPAEPRMDSFEVEGSIRANGIDFLEEKYFKVRKWKPEDSITCYTVKKSRDVFAIPAYSNLNLEFSLDHDGSEFIDKRLKPSPFGFRTGNMLYLNCKDEEYSFSMCVDWECPAAYFGLLPQLRKPVISEECVEVFSIFFGGGDATPTVCGTIVVQDQKQTVYIFSRKHEYPDTLSASNKYQRFRRTVSLAWPDCWILEKDFFMHLKLKDNHGNRVCRGGINLSYDSEAYPTRFDRRICDVILGDNGHFVAVNYSIFRNGLRATVTVVCEGPGSSSFGVYGSVYAEYNNHDYSSMYDQNYFRIIIFNRPEKYRAKVENCSEIPLSKSKFTAPADCGHIVVYVDLTIRPNVAPFNDLYAFGKLQFEANGMECTNHVQIYRRQQCMGRVTVKVDWKS